MMTEYSMYVSLNEALFQRVKKVYDSRASLSLDEDQMKLLEDIFTDAFMQQHTRFDNFEGFQFSSAVILNWKADTLVYAPLLLDAFVKESTRFGSWDEMVRTATQLRYHS